MPAVRIVSQLLTILTACLLQPLNWARAAAEPESDWQLAALPEPALQLETPPNGEFFVTTATGRYRSDDAGASWTPAPLNLPAGLQRAAFDPLDPAIHYANGATGLFKTVDGGATWTQLLPPLPGVPRLAVSPADHNLLYLAKTVGSNSGSFLRSRDGGLTWQEQSSQDGAGNSPCSYEVDLLQPHPTDPNRVFRTAGCFAGRNFGHPLSESRDQAANWTLLFNPKVGFPHRLIGGQGADPDRFYLLARHGMASYSVIFRSDDDAQTWRPIYELNGGGDTVPPGTPRPTISAIAYDPATPDQLFLAFGGGQSGVLSSPDGGQTWTPLGRQDLGPTNDLALGLDGRNLYAATDQGVWRLCRQ